MPQPNVVLVLVDDMGFSDIGCYGGEVRTPNLDRLARGGVRFSQFYNTARCSPSRASLLTGLHPHQTGIGILTNDDRPRGYSGTINPHCVTIAEALKTAGYATCLAGKWHLSSEMRQPNEAWPTRRGFDRFFGTLTGCGSFFQPGTLTRGEANAEHEALAPGFYYTDAITDEACAFVHEQTQPGAAPFFLYLAYTAPHWPLHAREADVAKYDGSFDVGWDLLRERRMQRLRDEGLLDGATVPSGRDPTQPAWADAEHKAWQHIGARGWGQAGAVALRRWWGWQAASRARPHSRISTRNQYHRPDGSAPHPATNPSSILVLRQARNAAENRRARDGNAGPRPRPRAGSRPKAAHKADPARQTPEPTDTRFPHRPPVARPSPGHP